MFSLNRAEIVGNVTRDPELRYIPSGQAVCSFSVATNRRWKDKDGNNQDQAEFHNIVAWGKVAELMGQLTHKGTKIYVEGRLQTRSWEGQDGNTRNRTEIVMEDFIVFTPKGATGSSDAIPGTAEHTESPADETPTAKTEKSFDATQDKESPKGKKETDKKPLDDAPAEDEINLDEIPF